MEIDINNFLKETEDYLNKRQENAGNNSNENTYPLIYPGARGGELTVRLLWNVKAQNVFRTIARHGRPSTDSKKAAKVPCLSCYGKECPICSTVKEIEDRTGNSLIEFRRKEHTLAFAQLIDHNSAYTNMPAKGSIILLMFPRSIKDGFLKLLQSSGENSKILLASNETRPFKILTGAVVSTNMYTVTIDAFGTFKSFQTDKEFEDCLNNLPNLNEMVIPADVDDNLMNTINAAAETIRAQNDMGVSDMPVQPQQNFNQQFTQTPQQVVQQQVNQQAAAQAVQQSTTIVNQQPQPVAQMTMQQPVQENMTINPQQMLEQSVQAPTLDQKIQEMNNSDKPSCFGNYSMTDKKCLICPHGQDCAQMM